MNIAGQNADELGRNPMVSVIMPSYNTSRCIVNSIQAVLNQTYREIELIICDDASSDSSAKLISSIPDSRIVFLQHDVNSGVSSARNTALQRASGRYIAFCDSDDIWYPGKLNFQLRAMKDSNCSVSHSNCDLIDENGDIFQHRSYPDEVSYSMMRFRNFICNSSGIYDQFLLGKHFQQDIFHEDYLMWLEIMKIAKVSVGVQKPLLQYSVRADSLSSNKIQSFLGSTRIQRQHGASVFECGINLLRNVFSRVCP